MSSASSAASSAGDAECVAAALDDGTTVRRLDADEAVPPAEHGRGSSADYGGRTARSASSVVRWRPSFGSDRARASGAQASEPLATAGADVQAIAEQLGHTDGGVLVLRRYGHLFKGTRRQAALALDEHVRSSATLSADGAQQELDNSPSGR